MTGLSEQTAPGPEWTRLLLLLILGFKKEICTNASKIGNPTSLKIALLRGANTHKPEEEAVQRCFRAAQETSVVGLPVFIKLCRQAHSVSGCK